MMMTRFSSRCGGSGVLCLLVALLLGLTGQVSSFVPSSRNIPDGSQKLRLLRSGTTTNNAGPPMMDVVVPSPPPPRMVVMSTMTLAATKRHEDDSDNGDNDTFHHINNHNTVRKTSTTTLLSSSRRKLLSLLGLVAVGGGGGGTATTIIPTNTPAVANAAVTDATDQFGDNWWTKDVPSSSSTSPFIDVPPSSPKKTSSSSSSSSSPGATATTTATVPSDEVSIQISKQDLTNTKKGGGNGGLGIELGEIEFRTNLRVIVKSVTPGSLADQLGIQKDWIVIGIDGQGTERTNAEGVAMMVYRAAARSSSSSSRDGGGGEGGDFVELKFRDPTRFRNQLQTMGSSSGGGGGGGGENGSSSNPSVVTTQIAPSGDTTSRNNDGSVQIGKSITSQENQQVSVSQLVPPKLCRHGADIDDLLEISYMGTVVETGQVFDGSAIKINGQGIPGRGNDVSIFFVLGKQPFGQFPPGWDVGLYGICVGERRRLLIPPALAYGSVGVPRRGIPPNATLQYDVTLISLNGLAIPQ